MISFTSRMVKHKRLDTEGDRTAGIIKALEAYGESDIRFQRGIRINGKWRPNDIAVYRGNALFFIIEVKAGDKFRTLSQRQAAEDQVEDYARANGCELVAWSDGETIYFKSLANPSNVVCARFLSARFPSLLNPLPSFALPHLIAQTPEEYANFPVRQRGLSLHKVPLVRVERALPDFDLGAFIAQPAPGTCILGEPDVGKSISAIDIAADPAWNCVYIDGANLARGLEAELAAEVKLIYGAAHEPRAFLARVAEFSQSELGLPLAFVIDGFDEWYARAKFTAANELGSFLTFARELGAKVLIFSRSDASARILQNAGQLPDLRRPFPMIQVLNDVELDRFISAYFDHYHIGGTISGNAREMCRIPAMLAIIAETFSGSTSIDPNITEPDVYRKYCDRKIGKIQDRSAFMDEQIALALDTVAMTMKRDDVVAIQATVLAPLLGTDMLQALIDERLLSPSHPGAGDQFVRFYYNKVRDHLLMSLAIRLGVDPRRLILDQSGWPPK